VTVIDGETKPGAADGARFLAVSFGLWIALGIALSASGVFLAVGGVLFPAFVVVGTIGVTASYFVAPSVRALCEHLGPYGLAWFHVWRIVAGLVFVYYGAQGWLPELFTSRAGWGDFVAGMLAIALFLLPRRFWSLLGFHMFGFVDLGLALGTGVYLNTAHPGTMDNITLLPIALIPMIGVPLSLASHVAAFDLMLKGRRD